jgi:tRNA dimethylallyltransferase
MITILGHTAGGKTVLAARVAYMLGGEIISADSRQVYRGMDIGTGKDYEDYIVNGRHIPYHLVDIREAGEEYNVFAFRSDFIRVFGEIRQREKLPILCGGTGLYIEALLRDYKMTGVPVNHTLRSALEEQTMEALETKLRSYGPLHNTTDTSTRKRLVRAIEIAEYQSRHTTSFQSLPAFVPLVVGLRFERNERRRRITRRLEERLEGGLIGEVESLMNKGLTVEKMEYYGLEYKYVAWYLVGKLTYDEMFDSLNTAIHRFAKRQMTYFRGMERRGISIRWLKGEQGVEENASTVAGWYEAT